jgi:hypothetical protein
MSLVTQHASAAAVGVPSLLALEVLLASAAAFATNRQKVAVPDAYVGL